MGQIITFYSYKGGVGRSMALANVGVVLSRWGFKTLLIDWDLEAPGLENFFHEDIKIDKVEKAKGVLDFLIAAQENNGEEDWKHYITPIITKVSKEPIHLIPAGKRDATYFARLRNFDVSKFYEEHNGGKIIEKFRNELKEAYDYVLVDSRTGVTDVGGICTIQMPDILTLLFTPTEQGLRGIKFIADSARKGQQNLPSTRKRILIFPVPTRIDSNTEFKTSKEWTERFAKELADYYDDWLPEDVEPNRFIEQIKLPYISYFSYGEKLPFIEQGTDDRGGLGFAYENLAALLAAGLDDAKRFVEERDDYVRQFSKNGNGSSNANISKKGEKVKVFISFANGEADLKEKFVEIFFPNGLFSHLIPCEIWSQYDIRVGQNFQNGVVSGIRSADVFIVLMSDTYFINSNKNKWELDKAIEIGHPVKLPVRAKSMSLFNPGYDGYENPLRDYVATPRKNPALFSGRNLVVSNNSKKEVEEDLLKIFASIFAKKQQGQTS